MCKKNIQKKKQDFVKQIKCPSAGTRIIAGMSERIFGKGGGVEI